MRGLLVPHPLVLRCATRRLWPRISSTDSRSLGCTPHPHIHEHRIDQPSQKLLFHRGQDREAANARPRSRTRGVPKADFDSAGTSSDIRSPRDMRDEDVLQGICIPPASYGARAYGYLGASMTWSASHTESMIALMDRQSIHGNSHSKLSRGKVCRRLSNTYAALLKKIKPN